MIRHKYFVYQEGRKLGVGRMQLLFHDWQKFTPTEWPTYVEVFYGKGASPRRADGGYDPNAVSEKFDYAWNHHQKVGGKHHWQYWVLPLDNGDVRALEMPEKYRKEMIADWYGAGRANSRGNNSIEWYEVNKTNMTLHPVTRELVEKEIGYVK